MICFSNFIVKNSGINVLGKRLHDLFNFFGSSSLALSAWYANLIS